MPIYNLIEYSFDCSKTSGSLWQYYRDEPSLNNDGNIVNFPGNKNSFKSKIQTTEKSLVDSNTKDVKIAV